MKLTPKRLKELFGYYEYFGTLTQERMMELFNCDEDPEILTQERVRDLFNYNPETGNLIDSIKGTIVGCMNSYYYLIINVDGVDYGCHQIIWLYEHNVLTTKENKLQIDHINRIRFDNRLCNLRLTNASGNARNIGLQSNNTSGITGVNFIKRTNKWIAYIGVNKQSINLGRYDNFINAIQARYDAEIKYDYPMENSTSRKYLDL